MKPFSSSILVNESAKSRQTKSFNEMAKKQSYIACICQFNEGVVEAEVKETKQMLQNILDNVNKNGLYVSDDLRPSFDKIDTIMNLIDTLINGVDRADMTPGASDREYEIIMYNRLIDALKVRKFSPDVKVTMIANMKHVPNTPIDNCDGYGPVHDYIMSVIKNARTLTDEIVDSLNISTVYRTIGDLTGVPGDHILESPDDVVNEYNNLFEYVPTEVSAMNAAGLANDACNKVNGAYVYISTYNIRNDVIGLTSVLKAVASTYENKEIIRRVIDKVCDCLTSISLIVAGTRAVESYHFRTIMKFNYNSLKHLIPDQAEFTRSPVNGIDNNGIVVPKMPVRPKMESSMEFFGDTVDADSVFETLEPGDFNPTNFMDLKLVDESVLNIQEMRVIMDCMKLEASLLEAGDLEKLVTSMNEALLDKAKNVGTAMLETIKKLIAKFMENFLYKAKFEGPWLKKYKDIILNNGWGDRGVKFNCYYDHRDIFNLVNIPPVNYADLVKNANGAFESEEAFFQHFFGGIDGCIRGHGKYRDTLGIIKDDMSLADKCKYMMGARFPDNITGKEIKYNELDIKGMYDWLLATENLTAQIKKQQTALEHAERSYKTSLNSLSTQGDKDQKAADTGVKNEYYSFIYEVELSQAPKDAKPVANNGSQSTATGKVNTPQVKVGDYNMKQSDTDKEVQGAKETTAEVDKRMKIYFKVCKDVIAAELTGIANLRKEYMDLMRSVVRAKVGADADLRVTDKAAEANAAKNAKKEELNKQQARANNQQ